MENIVDSKFFYIQKSGYEWYMKQPLGKNLQDLERKIFLVQSTRKKLILKVNFVNTNKVSFDNSKNPTVNKYAKVQ